MIYNPLNTPQFLEAVERLKQLRLQKLRLTVRAKQRVRLALRKIREC